MMFLVHLFGWRKTSKCKKLLKRARCRLKLLKNKRLSITHQCRNDVGQLLRSGHSQIAFNRIEQLIRDEDIIAVYEMLDQFCEFIIISLPYILKTKDCPNDINEAISSLIYASARFGDLQELQQIKKLFEERYGHGFARAAIQSLPGNLVNCQLKEKLTRNEIPLGLKKEMVDEISRQFCYPLKLEYSSELQQQQQKMLSDPRQEEVPYPNIQIYHYSMKEPNSEKEEPKTITSSESPAMNHEDAQEFRTSTKESDLRLFVFKSSAIQKHENHNQRDISVRRSIESAKRSRRRHIKQSMKDVEFELYYGDSKFHHRKKPEKRIKERKWENLNQQVVEIVIEEKKMKVSNSFSNGFGSSSSPCHVHPKLPNYDELAANFRALKKAYLQNSTLITS